MGGQNSKASFHGYADEVPGDKLGRSYTRTCLPYNSIDEMTEALARAGLNSLNLIVGIDFTKCNEWTGARSLHKRNLHHIGDGLNPYEQSISIIGKTLAGFNEDNLIPCFGFGDASTRDQGVFSFYPDERSCNGYEELLTRYRELVPELQPAGPTSFAPIIEMAMTIVQQSGGQYHVLVIIADGQVTRSIDTKRGTISPQEHDTVHAIVKAREFPLSTILVGVGDGPWDMMEEFHDNIPARAFDNFEFVNFREIITSKNVPPLWKEEAFALAALREIPSQYKATLKLNILGRRIANAPERVPRPPPLYISASFGGLTFYGSKKHSRTTSFEPRVPPYHGESSTTSFEPRVPPYHGESSPVDNQLCPICLTNSKGMAFSCGHQACSECGEDLDSCPVCRSPIDVTIDLD